MEALRNTLWVLAALFQIGAIIFGLWANFVGNKISKESSSKQEKQHDALVSKLENVEKDVHTISLPIFQPRKDSTTSLDVKKLEFPQVVKLIEELGVQNKLLNTSYTNALSDHDYIRDLSVRLNFLIGSEKGLLFLLYDKLELTTNCKLDIGGKKEEVEYKNYFSRKCMTGIIDGKEVRFSIQDIIHQSSSNEGGTSINLKCTEIFGGRKEQDQNVIDHVLLTTAKQLIRDIEIFINTANEFHIKPLQLVVNGDDFRNENKYDQAIKCFNEAQRILSKIYPPDSQFLIQIEVHLSCVYYWNEDFPNALFHGEKANELIGKRNFTGNLVPTAKECLAYSLMKTHVPGTTPEDKDAYSRCKLLLNQAISLKKQNADRDQTPLHLNYYDLTIAHLFTDDYASALDSIQEAIKQERLLHYITLEGVAGLGLKMYGQANRQFDLNRTYNKPELADSLIKYSNAIASGEVQFSLPEIWEIIHPNNSWK